MTPGERAEVERAKGGRFLAEGFDYTQTVTPVRDKRFYAEMFPGFPPDIIEVLVRYENGMRAKEHRAWLKKQRAKADGSKNALVAIRQYRHGISPF